MRRITVIYLTAVFSLMALSAFAQANSGLLKTLQAVAGMRDRFPIEKVYLQTDKPYYTLGDTLRFKAYLLNGDFLKPSIRSGLMYIELDDVNNKLVTRSMVPVASGITWGNIPLDEKEIPEGVYTLRASTNWMLNFDENYIFKKTIYISSIKGNSTLVKADYKVESLAGKDKISAGILLSTLDGNPIRLKDVRLRIFSGYRTLFRDKVNTGMDGRMRLNFDLTDRTAINNLNIQAQQLGDDVDTTTLFIPVAINRPEKSDVQFMPEGGSMVAGIPVKIGFKAITEDGRGVDVTGKIINSKQQTVATISTAHKGMGLLQLTPQAGESYAAKMSLPNNTILNYPLPGVSITGTTLSITPKSKDELTVTINATPDLLNSPNNYYLIGQTRGLVCYTAAINFKGSAITKTIAKDLFPTGIAHFTLLNNNNQPLNERIVFIDHDNNLRVAITTAKTQYGKRDSIAVAVNVKDKDGKPIRGTFSVAVTDDSQVRTDSTDNNLISDMLLTSDLKGTVEEPGWYFQNNTTDRLAALDNLLLTQGWIGYDWKAIFNPVIQQPTYLAEKGFSVQGTMLNVFNKPVKQTIVTLFQKKPLLALESKTDDQGRFVFKDKRLFPTDSSSYMIQGKRNNGDDRNFNIEVTIDDYTPPEFKPSKERLLPWYYNSDTTLLNNASIKMAQLQAETNGIGGGRMLKEVVIKEQKIIPDSHNLNGDGESDVVLTKKDLEKQRSHTLYELLTDRFPDFGKDEQSGRISYYLGQQLVVLVIDGVRPGKFKLTTDIFMDGLRATDIKGIEVMTSSKYTTAYFPPPSHFNPDVAFLEITTYSHNGVFLNKTPGRFVYKPIPISVPKQFYSPKYTINNKNMSIGTDVRSTIFWEPQVVTDNAGNATLSFYSADKATNYTLILEGTDLNGNFGYSRQKIKIIPATTPK